MQLLISASLSGTGVQPSITEEVSAIATPACNANTPKQIISVIFRRLYNLSLTMFLVLVSKGGAKNLKSKQKHYNNK